MKRVKHFSIWIIALLAMTVTNYAWAADTQKPKPGCNGDIQIGTVTGTTIAVSWCKATDNVIPQDQLVYWVLWKLKSASGWQVTPYTKNMTSYTITGLTPNTEYDVMVSVHDAAVNGINYKSKRVRTNAPPVPGCNGKITVTEITADMVRFTWCKATDKETPQNELQYKIWKKDLTTSQEVSSKWWKDLDHGTFGGLIPNRKYRLDVKVKDASGNEKWYGEIIVQTDKDTQDPTPGSYEAGYPKATGPTTIEVKWTRGTDNITPQSKLRYNIMWKKLPDGVWEYSHESNYPVDITSYTITGLQPNTEYKVDVSVRDEANNSVFYGEKTVKTKQAADTQYPTPGTLTVGTVTANSIALSWTRGTDNVTPQSKLKYRVYWKKKSDSAWQGGLYETDITSYTITGLVPNTEYKVDVRVEDEAGNGGLYGEKTVKTKQATTPSVPVTGVTLNRNSVTIDGDYSTIQLTATVHPSNASDKSLTWASSDPTVVSVDSKGLVTIHKKGKARVTATANDGSGQSDTCLFDVIRTVANETVDGLRVYAHGSALYLTLPKAETIHIYNVGGSLVKTLALPAGDHVQPLAPGMYLVRVGEQVTKILVK